MNSPRLFIGLKPTLTIILARILVKQSNEVRSAGEMVEVWEELSLDTMPPMYLRHDGVWKHTDLVLS